MSRSDEAKLEYWTKRIEDWKSSGVSQRAYCKCEGYKFATFDYWRRQMRLNGATAKPAAKGATTNDLTLVRVRVADQVQGENIVLRSPGGWQLTMPGTIDSQWLAAFMRSMS